MKASRPLSIAIIGTRGIPASYGGFETLAEELSTRLVARGHRVAVYCRSYGGKERDRREWFRGVRLFHLPAVRQKYLETPLHSLLCFLDLFRRRFDVVLLCNAANSPFSWLMRLRGLPFAVNLDGIERKRGKWNLLGRLWYQLGEISSVLFANRLLADADVISEYYSSQYGASCDVIAYGADSYRLDPGPTLKQFDLRPNQYLLYVSRLEPENNALGVIEAYNSIQATMPLVIVGDAPYSASYIKKLHKTAGPGVVFTGYQFGDSYRELRSNCYAYIQATEVGGTHPALVEAMACGNCIIANDVPEHREVLGGSGLFYPRNDFSALALRMKEVLSDPALPLRYGRLAKARAATVYNWQLICEQYEELFAGLLI